jgi:spore maturation protein CgeB
VTKVLIAHPGPHYSVADVYNGLLKGLRQNGVDARAFNLDDRIEFYTRAEIQKDDGEYVRAFKLDDAIKMAAKTLEVMCYEWWPDIVIIVSGFYVPPEVWGVLARRPHHTVYYCTESPYEDDRQGRAARYADTVILNDPTNLNQYRDEVNKNTHYFPHSYDPDIHFPGTPVPELASDFAFVGTGFPSRSEWLERVDWTGIKAVLGGYWAEVPEDSILRSMLLHGIDHCMDNVTTANVYRSTKASLNLYRKEHSFEAHALGWAMGPREVELAACGTFFFREARGEGDALFPSHPIVHSPEDFAQQLRWWLAHDRQREAAVAQALEAVADRTFTNTAARLLRVLEATPLKIAA